MLKSLVREIARRFTGQSLEIENFADTPYYDESDLARSDLAKELPFAYRVHNSDELASLLLVIADKYPLRGAARENYLKIANQIRSEYERNRALAAVATKATM